MYSLPSVHRPCLRAGLSALILALISGCTFGSSPTNPTTPAVTVTTVVVSGSSGAATVGQTVTFAATAAFSDNTTSNVTTQATWESSNPAVATVSPTGVATFLAVGTVDVRATFRSVTGSTRVAVGGTAPPVPTVTGVAVTGVGSAASPGQTVALVATATFSDATTLNVTNQAAWQSSNTSVATVSPTGVATFISAGAVDFRATYRNVVGVTRVTVAASSPTVTRLDLTGVGSSALVGQSATLVATATYSDNTAANVTAQASWSSSNTNVATVSGGSVAFVGAGDVDLRATFDGVTGSIRVAVTSQVVLRTIQGVVTDSVSGLPVAGVEVLALGGPNEGRKVLTDANGAYALVDLVAGSFRLQFSTEGAYSPTSRDVTLTADSRIDVALTPGFGFYYGTFNIILTVTLDTCTTPVIPGPTGTLELTGTPDGSNFSAKLTERGVSRTYVNGKMKGDGSFSATLPLSLLPGGFQPLHDVSGTIQGKVTGNSINGTETLVYTLPCIGKFINTSFSGGR